MVTMIHPNLPGQPITVAESAVPIYERSGWEVPAEPQETAPPTQPDPDKE